MGKKKIVLILILVFVLLLGGAYVLYTRLEPSLPYDGYFAVKTPYVLRHCFPDAVENIPLQPSHVERLIYQSSSRALIAARVFTERRTDPRHRVFLFYHLPRAFHIPGLHQRCYRLRDDAQRTALPAACLNSHSSGFPE